MSAAATAAAAAATAAAATAGEPGASSDNEASSDDESVYDTLAHPVSRLDSDGIPLNLAAGMSASLMPSSIAPLPEDQSTIEFKFQQSRREPFDWDAMPPGKRPDTLVIKGLPCDWFELTPATLDRERVISACSRLRRVLETFGDVRDLDVRPHDPEDPLQTTSRLRYAGAAFSTAPSPTPAVAPLDGNDDAPAGSDAEVMSQLSERSIQSPKNQASPRQGSAPNALLLLEEDRAPPGVAALLDTHDGPSAERAAQGAEGIGGEEQAVESGSATREVDPLEEGLTPEPTYSPRSPAPENQSTASSVNSLFRADMFEAIVQYRSYLGFLETLRMFGGKDMLKVDMHGVEAAAPLSVECDYQGFFSRESLTRRAGAERERIRKQAAQRIEQGRAELQLERRVRHAKQDARVAAVSLELRMADITEIPRAILNKDAWLTKGVAAAHAAFDFTQERIQAIDAIAGHKDGEAMLDAALDHLRDALDETDRRITQAERRHRTVLDQAKLDLPNFDEALLAAGCSIFLGLVKQHWGALGLGPTLEGRTILVPDDAAFLGSVDNWEAECWGLHVCEVPLLVGDLCNYPGGKVQPLDRHPKHALRARADLTGLLTIWVYGDSDPPRRAAIIKGDVKVNGGTIVHVLDRILYPP